jgi:hypothetical protein
MTDAVKTVIAGEKIGRGMVYIDNGKALQCKEMNYNKALECIEKNICPVCSLPIIFTFVDYNIKGEDPVLSEKINKFTKERVKIYSGICLACGNITTQLDVIDKELIEFIKYKEIYKNHRTLIYKGLKTYLELQEEFVNLIDAKKLNMEPLPDTLILRQEQAEYLYRDIQYMSGNKSELNSSEINMKGSTIRIRDVPLKIIVI